MGYSYSPQSTDERARLFFGRRGKHLAIAAVVIILSAIFYFTGNALTTYATYSDNLEQQLADANLTIKNIQAQADSCQSGLSIVNSNLDNTNIQLNACKNNLTTTGSLLSTCNTDKNIMSGKVSSLTTSLDRCTSEKDSMTQSFKQLVRNSVKAICCSYGDMQAGTTRGWQITNNSISCTGTYSVNCTSGETNY